MRAADRELEQVRDGDEPELLVKALCADPRVTPQDGRTGSRCDANAFRDERASCAVPPHVRQRRHAAQAPGRSRGPERARVFEERRDADEPGAFERSEVERACVVVAL